VNHARDFDADAYEIVPLLDFLTHSRSLCSPSWLGLASCSAIESLSVSHSKQRNTSIPARTLFSLSSHSKARTVHHCHHENRTSLNRQWHLLNPSSPYTLGSHCLDNTTISNPFPCTTSQSRLSGCCMPPNAQGGPSTFGQYPWSNLYTPPSRSPVSPDPGHLSSTAVAANQTVRSAHLQPRLDGPAHCHFKCRELMDI